MLKVTFFGTTTLLFDDGTDQILFDAHFTRPSLIKYIAGASALFFIEYFLIFKAYKFCNAITLQPFDFTRLLFMMIMSDLLLNEHIVGSQIIGGLVILSGYAVILIHKRFSLHK